MSSLHIPRRSKRCITCQVRKKGCDLKVPACGQCRLGGLECQGYARGFVWVDAPDRAKPQLRSQNIAQRKGLARTQAISVIQPEPLTRAARNQRLAGIFWSHYLPNGRPISRAASVFGPGGWTNVALQLQDAEPALECIALAFGSGFMSRSQQLQGLGDQRRLLQLQSLQLYYRAVAHLKQAAGDSKRVHSDGVLATTRLVQAYEMHFGSKRAGTGDGASTFSNVTIHFKGQISILCYRGPASFTSGLSHAMFVDSRLYMAVSAIFVRMKLSISSSAWKSIPWILVRKEPKDTLTDIILDIGSLLDDLDKLRASRGPAQKRDKLLAKAVEVQLALDHWHGPFAAEVERFDCIKPTDTPVELTNDRDLSFVYLLSIYWCARMLIDTTLRYIQLVDIRQKRQNTSNEGRQQSLHDAGEERQGLQDRELDAEGLEVLAASAPYAYKISRIAHLLCGPNVGVCIYSMGIVPIALALSLLTAFEPAQTASPERQRLGYLFVTHALSGWATNFAEETETRARNEELAKARRLRWWTRGL